MKTLLLLAALALTARAIPLTVLPWNAEIAERELAVGRDEVDELPYLHPDARSEPVDLPAETDGLQLLVLDRTGADNQPLGLPLRFPADCRRPLLILLPDAGSKAGLRPFVVDDDLRELPWGSFRIFNASDQPLAFRWDKLAKRLKPGWSPELIEPGGPPRNLEVFLYRQDALDKPLYTAVWEHRADMRQLVFVVPSDDASLGPYRFKVVPELRLPEPEAPDGEDP